MFRTWRSKIFSLLSLILLLKLVSCSVYDDLTDCSSIKLRLVLVDSISFENIINKIDPISVYLFKSNRYVRKVETENNKSIYLAGYEKKDSISIAIWGNLKKDSVEIIGLNVGSKPDDIYIKLIRDGDLSQEPSDLFYTSYKLNNDSGFVDIRAGETYEDTTVLTLRRIVTSVQIVAKHLVERFGNDTSEMHFKLKGLKNSINFNGKLSGSEAIYSPYTFFNPEGNLMTKVFKILPAPGVDYITVELYKKNELIFSTNKDSNGNLLRPTSGNQLNIVIDFYRTNINIKTLITPWGEIWQETTM